MKFCLQTAGKVKKVVPDFALIVFLGIGYTDVPFSEWCLEVLQQNKQSKRAKQANVYHRTASLIINYLWIKHAEKNSRDQYWQLGNVNF